MDMRFNEIPAKCDKKINKIFSNLKKNIENLN